MAELSPEICHIDDRSLSLVEGGGGSCCLSGFDLYIKGFLSSSTRYFSYFVQKMVPNDYCFTKYHVCRNDYFCSNSRISYRAETTLTSLELSQALLWCPRLSLFYTQQSAGKQSKFLTTLAASECLTV